jgi:hypothetical protein
MGSESKHKEIMIDVPYPDAMCLNQLIVTANLIKFPIKFPHQRIDTYIFLKGKLIRLNLAIGLREG